MLVIQSWFVLPPILSLSSCCHFCLRHKSLNTEDASYLGIEYRSLWSRCSTFLGFAFQDHTCCTSLLALTSDTFAPDSQSGWSFLLWIFISWATNSNVPKCEFIFLYVNLIPHISVFLWWWSLNFNSECFLLLLPLGAPRHSKAKWKGEQGELHNLRVWEEWRSVQSGILWDVYFPA